MNKKFLSVVVFGALLASSAGTFTSCKDYDDDIDAVNGRIDELAKSLSDLQAKVGSFVKSVTYDPATGKLTVVDGENNSVSYTIGQNLPTYSISVDKEGKISLLKDGEVVSSGTITFPDAPTTPTIPDAFDPSKLTVDPTTGKVMYDGKETGVTIPGDGVLSIEDKKNAEGVVIGYTIKYKDQAVTFALNDVLTLKGLVFKSDLFVDGIEAIEYPYLDYTYKAGTATSDIEWPDEQAEQVICKVTMDPKEWNYTGATGAQYNPIEYINYHLNPSSAKVSKEDLSFVSRDVEVISSRASVALPEVADMKPADEGILPVGFRAIGKDIAKEIIKKMDLDKAREDKKSYTIEFLMGSPDDNAALFLCNGIQEGLQEYLDDGTLVCKSGNTSFDDTGIMRWSETSAKTKLDSIISEFYAEEKAPDIICTAYDGFAYAAEEILSDSGLEPGSDEWPMITGYGSEAQAVKDIAAGKMSFTMFMDRKELAKGGAQMAIDYLTGEKVDVKDYSQYDNGVKIVGTFTCGAQMIDKDNYQILVDNGTYTEDEIAPDPSPTREVTPAAEATPVPIVTFKGGSEEDSKEVTPTPETEDKSEGETRENLIYDSEDNSKVEKTSDQKK